MIQIMKKIMPMLMGLILLAPIAIGMDQDDTDISLAGLELEKLLNLGSGILAGILFVITLAAYKRTKNTRLIYVSSAFLLFAIKGFFTSHELFISEVALIDPIASILNLAIIASFFLGVVKR